MCIVCIKNKENITKLTYILKQISFMLNNHLFKAIQGVGI